MSSSKNAFTDKTALISPNIALRANSRLNYVQASLTAIFRLLNCCHFCVHTLVCATRQFACSTPARCARLGKQLRLRLLDQFDFVSCKPIL